MKKFILTHRGKLLFLCVILVAAFCFRFLGFRFNYSDSLPYYLFRVTPMSDSTVINRNDFVAFMPTSVNHPMMYAAIERRYFSPNIFIIKEIAAIEGDTVLIKDERIYVNGASRRLSIMTHDSQNRYLTAFPTPFVVDIDSFFLTSNPAGGFDSRYFGPINRDIIRYIATPIF